MPRHDHEIEPATVVAARAAYAANPVTAESLVVDLLALKEELRVALLEPVSNSGLVWRLNYEINRVEMLLKTAREMERETPPSATQTPTSTPEEASATDAGRVPQTESDATDATHASQ